MSVMHVISVSGGKDSDATLLLALNRYPNERVIPVFCDTGNEHDEVYRHLDYLEQALDITITRLKANFDKEIARKRIFIARDRRIGREYKRVPKTDHNGQPVLICNKDGTPRLFPVYADNEDGEPTDKIIGYKHHQKIGWNSGRKRRWSNKAKRKALSALHPTGNPYLDLCLWKGRFPSRKAQFCTQELKRDLLVTFQMELVDQGHRVVSWQGIRRDESLNRRNAKQFERLNPRMFAYRPLVDWTAMQVFDFLHEQKLIPNTLYKRGMNRVGCMPCINAGKHEIAQIAARFPDHIDRIAEWEHLVSAASKRGFSTFFNKELHENAGNDRRVHAANRIDAVIDYARTSHGGRQYDLFASHIDATECVSAYGLCEQIS